MAGIRTTIMCSCGELLHLTMLQSEHTDHNIQISPCEKCLGNIKAKLVATELERDHLKTLLKKSLKEIIEHNKEYKYVTSKDFINAINDVLQGESVPLEAILRAQGYYI